MGNCDLSEMSDPHNEFKGKNVLIERKDSSEMASKYGMSIETYQEILGECRRKLFEVRLKRPKPHLDDKVLGISLRQSIYLGSASSDLDLNLLI